MKRNNIYVATAIVLLMMFTGNTVAFAVKGNIGAAFGWFNATLWMLIGCMTSLHSM